MKDYVEVNGVKVPILKALPMSKIRGRSNCILIISWNCEVHHECQKYCDLHGIKILRMD